MISLKSYCEPLAEILGLTPDGLYERQRVLTRSGFLTGAVAGKGPGSGIRATIGNVTKLLISTLATDSLSEIDEKTRKIAAMKHVGGKCPLTGEVRFLKAVEKVFADSLYESCSGIAVDREDPSASIYIRNSAQLARSQSNFGRDRHTPNPVPFSPGIRITATVESFTLLFIASDIEDIADGKPPGSQNRY